MYLTHITKVSVLFDIQDIHPRSALLLRLPPLNVSLTPEVRCAVVGNVDSGKSTTLGVLTGGKSLGHQAKYNIFIGNVQVLSTMAEEGRV